MPILYRTKNHLSKRVNIESQNDIMQQIYKPKKCESHRIASIMARHINESFCDESSRSYRMFHCGEYIKLDTPFRISTGEIFYNRTSVVGANFCRDRFCPMCAYRLSRKTGMNLAKCIKVLHDCHYQFIFITLTMPNVKSDDLSDAIDIMFDAWRRFYHLKNVQCAFKGYFKALEVTYNSDTQTYHPHLHILVAVNKSYFTSANYINRDTLFDYWKRCLNRAILKNGNANISDLARDDFYICDIRKVQDSENNFLKTCLELSKYISKSNDITDITFDAFFSSLSGVRSFEYIGVFKVVYKTLKMNDDILDESIDDFDIGHIFNCYSFDYDDMIYALRKSEK